MDELSASEFWKEAHFQGGLRVARQIDDEAEEAFWQNYAPGYDEKSPLAQCASELIDAIRALIDNDWHMVEIGSGPGAFTRRLAPSLSRIAVVEPSAAMRSEFERLWDARTGVDILPCKWEDAPDLRADLVFAANALYRIKDISSALLKMDATALHRVALVQTIGRPHANPLIVTGGGHTTECERADAICNVLAELGIDHERCDFEIQRPDGPSRAALIHWAPAAER